MRDIDVGGGEVKGIGGPSPVHGPTTRRVVPRSQHHAAHRAPHRSNMLPITSTAPFER
ncbi:hypothetical protein [Streptomyces coeruleorubidus]|uniref:hypothetical protein n=1 Tax=Streptomyces coeruleorubidus TaxID=116188 RepID=UPI0033ADFCB7